MVLPLHADGGVLDPGAILVGAVVGFGIWHAIRWLSARDGTRGRDGL
ncbi:hypothetical protein [Halorussus caseinilyticus]|uniref:Uncharacterized protein n=1 Tax=Halorussus caseinilyticus TaxID=3034025 RepID=A0ABD5WI22_9EURY|nr:hypothetical protein [Halorussus sp. DT72]